MGIRYLNTIINEFCNECIRDVSIKQLQFKILIIDANIYLYKFKTIGKLFENYEKMLNLLLDHNIEAVFVFDGKPDLDKYKTVKHRAIKKREALKKLNTLEKMGQDSNNTEKAHYSKVSTKVYKHEKDEIKALISSKGFQIVQAVNEADEICAYLDKNVAYATMTEDMDMFVYGCSRILKNFDIEQQTFDLIHTNEILDALNIVSHDDFKEICILAGTDYFYTNRFNIYVSLCLYMFYVQSEKHYNFLKWCYMYDLISKYQYYKFESIKDKFNIKSSYILNETNI